MACSSTAQSAALRAIGPTWSRLAANSNAPCRLTRPQLGFSPLTPLAAQGQRIDPPVSEASAP